MKWQPISTAPRDGQEILLSWPDTAPHADRVVSGWWDDEFEASGDSFRGAWTNGRVSSWGYEETVELMPTHWMPLPEPPGDE